MSVRYLVYLLVALAALAAGCAFIPGLMPQEKHVIGDVSSPIPIPATAPAAPLSQSRVSAGVTFTPPFDMDGAQWMEYRSSVNGGLDSDVRLDYRSNPLTGGKMVSLKRTQTSGGAAAVNTNTGGTLYSFSSSNTQSSVTSNMISLDKIREDDPILYAGEVSGSPEGTESVSVPKGDYNCQKYVTSFKGSYAEYWEAPGIPVPVKIYTACDGTTLKLVDWG